MRVLPVVLLLCLLLLSHTHAVRRRRASDDDDDDDARPASTPKSIRKTVVQRKLVSERVNAASVLKHHASPSDAHATSKAFGAETLVYVTPWNGKGYDIAKAFGAKFTYVSPVWLQIRNEGGRPVLTGTHDIDAGWMADVRAVCSSVPDLCPKITPRVIWEAPTLTSSTQLDQVKAVLEAAIVEHGFDGLVLEWGLNQALPNLRWLATLRASFRRSGKTLIFVLPPNVGKGGVTPEMFAALAKAVDRFSLMTYDYSAHRGRPGPNAPLPWMTQVVEALVPMPDPSDYHAGDDEYDEEDPDDDEWDGLDAGHSPEFVAAREAAFALRSTILMGLNFYGYDNTNAIVSHEYLSLVEEHRPKFTWDSSAEEHAFTYKGAGGRHAVYFPTLLSLQRRLELAEELGVGISVWEIGQGLDYWYDLM